MRVRGGGDTSGVRGFVTINTRVLPAFTRLPGVPVPWGLVKAKRAFRTLAKRLRVGKKSTAPPVEKRGRVQGRHKGLFGACM